MSIRNSRETGKMGEEFASLYLSKNGINIIDRNYFSKFGEIDLIGIENKTIIFIEVRLRSTKDFGLPFESITKSKLHKLEKTILGYLSEKEYGDYDCRFDIISLIYNENEENFCVEWLKNQDFT